MIWSHLACAACAQPVAEGRCPVCRHARAQLGSSPLPAALVAALAVLLTLLACLALAAALAAARAA